MEMKKLIVVIGCMLVLALPAFAEDFSISNMTYEELIKLRDDISIEFADRGVEVLPSGRYVVGKDIKPGKYLYTCCRIAESEKYVSIYIYEDETAEKNHDCILARLDSGEEYYMNLSENMIVLIANATGTLQAITPSWAP